MFLLDLNVAFVVRKGVHERKEQAHFHDAEKWETATPGSTAVHLINDRIRGEEHESVP